MNFSEVEKKELRLFQTKKKPILKRRGIVENCKIALVQVCQKGLVG